MYTFTERCTEDPDIILGDGTVKIFFNCCYKGEDIPDDLREFYNYVETGTIGNDLTRRIDTAVKEGRKNESLRERYNMLRRGKTVEEIVDFCGYTYEQVKKVEEALLATAST